MRRILYLALILSARFANAQSNVVPICDQQTTSHCWYLAGASTLTTDRVLTLGDGLITSPANILVQSGSSSVYPYVGLGRTAPDAYLGVVAVANNFATGTLPGDLAVLTENSANAVMLGSGSSGGAVMWVIGGDVGIGTRSPAAQLDLTGDAIIRGSSPAINAVNGYIEAQGFLSAVSGGSWQGVTSTTDGALLRGYGVAQNAGGTAGGYFDFAPITYPPSGSTDCYDAFGNHANQPKPLNGLSSFGANDLIWWNSLSPLQGYQYPYTTSAATLVPPYPNSYATCATTVTANVFYGTNTNGYIWAMGGFASGLDAFNTVHLFNGGVTAQSLLAGGFYSQGTVTYSHGTLSAPTFLGGYVATGIADQPPGYNPSAPTAWNCYSIATCDNPLTASMNVEPGIMYWDTTKNAGLGCENIETGSSGSPAWSCILTANSFLPTYTAYIASPTAESSIAFQTQYYNGSSSAYNFQVDYYGDISIAGNLHGLGYMDLSNYSTATGCTDIWSNNVTFPSPHGAGFSANDAVWWVGPSPLYGGSPSNCAPSPFINWNGTSGAQQVTNGINVNEYIASLSGLASLSSSYNSIQSLTGGIFAGTTLVTGQPWFMQGYTSSTSLLTPSGGFGNYITSATYVSGGTVTGSTGQYCAVGPFNGGTFQVGAQGLAVLTGTNSIAGATIGFINPTSGALQGGFYYSSSPTSAALNNGSNVVWPGHTPASCSGTIAISSTVSPVYWGGIGHKSGSVYWYWNSTTASWNTVDFAASSSGCTSPTCTMYAAYPSSQGTIAFQTQYYTGSASLYNFQLDYFGDISNAGPGNFSTGSEYETNSKLGVSVNPVAIRQQMSNAFASDIALSGAVIIPITVSSTEVDGVSGMVAAYGAGTNAVGVFGGAIAKIASANVWSMNSLVSDFDATANTSVAATNLIGMEMDVNVHNASTVNVLGLEISGNSVYTGSQAGTGASSAIYIHGHYASGNGPPLWQYPLFLEEGSGIIGIHIDARGPCASNCNGQASQQIEFWGRYTDGSPRPVELYADYRGNLILESGTGTQIPYNGLWINHTTDDGSGAALQVSGAINATSTIQSSVTGSTVSFQAPGFSVSGTGATSVYSLTIGAGGCSSCPYVPLSGGTMTGSLWVEGGIIIGYGTSDQVATGGAEWQPSNSATVSLGDSTHTFYTIAVSNITTPSGSQIIMANGGLTVDDSSTNAAIYTLNTCVSCNSGGGGLGIYDLSVAGSVFNKLSIASGGSLVLPSPSTSCSGKPSGTIVAIGWVSGTTPGTATVCP